MPEDKASPLPGVVEHESAGIAATRISNEYSVLFGSIYNYDIKPRGRSNIPET
jgi:hypothetical protein